MPSMIIRVDECHEKIKVYMSVALGNNILKVETFSL